MRLPEAKVKEAIVHPDKLVRQEALLYFTECHSRDAEVMPLAIRAIETFGRRNAFPYLHVLAQLTQTEATVEWIIKELHQEEAKSHNFDSYFPALSRLLCHTDPDLLQPHVDQILRSPGFFKELSQEFQERLSLVSWDADRCWQELERICTEGVGADVDLGHAHRVVEALARHGDKHIDRTLDLLGKEVEDFETDPMTWLEIFLVELAGEMRLERAVPLIVKKLYESGDFLSEECIDALGKIGTDAAAEAVTEGWLEAAWDYRLYAASALERIHSDTTVRKCLDLLPQDKDLDIRTELADALLSQYADEGIEPVREMVQRREYDSMTSDLMRKLVAVSTVLGVDFPEYQLWKREAEEKLNKQERRMGEMEGFLHAPARSALPPKLADARDEYPERKPAPFLRTEKPVGRNDPCRCGSGKKFKKCCMSRSK
jgi:hypothetical protein